MQGPDPREKETSEAPREQEPEEPRLTGTFAAARSASERDTFNTLEVGPRWTFSS